ncbi:hypothetical protein HOY82DRAFT_631039 [Tuber indicum]|nr:hypothetical protein HOY82DRAFT_631039 [Tuber indicum]
MTVFYPVGVLAGFRFIPIARLRFRNFSSPPPAQFIHITQAPASYDQQPLELRHTEAPHTEALVACQVKIQRDPMIEGSIAFRQLIRAAKTVRKENFTGLEAPYPMYVNKRGSAIAKNIEAMRREVAAARTEAAAVRSEAAAVRTKAAAVRLEPEERLICELPAMMTEAGQTSVPNGPGLEVTELGPAWSAYRLYRLCTTCLLEPVIPSGQSGPGFKKPGPVRSKFWAAAKAWRHPGNRRVESWRNPGQSRQMPGQSRQIP